MAWYIEGFSNWDKRYSVRCNLVPSSYWLKGEDLGKGVRVDGYAGQVLKATQVSNHKVLPDFFRVGTMPVCSDAFRVIVEKLEPNIHQFFPIEFDGGERGINDPKYFVFNVLSALDAILVERSAVFQREWEALSGTGKMTRYSRVEISSPAGLVVKKEEIKEHHMWRTANVLPRLLFFSDELMTQVAAAKLKKLTAFPAAEEYFAH
ncbi:imm11 family protein [Dongia sp.]|jgi:hypothetical protein|uniref:imm11 family protein n=1 Tax=Dongia sp. TaxID=1977262 RepID=UPI0035B36403